MKGLFYFVGRVALGALMVRKVTGIGWDLAAAFSFGANMGIETAEDDFLFRTDPHSYALGYADDPFVSTRVAM